MLICRTYGSNRAPIRMNLFSILMEICDILAIGNEGPNLIIQTIYDQGALGFFHFFKRCFPLLTLWISGRVVKRLTHYLSWSIDISFNHITLDSGQQGVSKPTLLILRYVILIYVKLRILASFALLQIEIYSLFTSIDSA